MTRYLSLQLLEHAQFALQGVSMRQILNSIKFVAVFLDSYIDNHVILSAILDYNVFNDPGTSSNKPETCEC